MPDYISINVFRTKGYNCTNGVSSCNDKLYMFNESLTIEQIKSICAEKNIDYKLALKVVTREIKGFYDRSKITIYKHLEPAINLEQELWSMSGGNFAYTPDSRFKEVSYSIYPLQIHDNVQG